LKFSLRITRWLGLVGSRVDGSTCLGSMTSFEGDGATLAEDLLLRLPEKEWKKQTEHAFESEYKCVAHNMQETITKRSNRLHNSNSNH
jgi:hypothetical protein